MPMPLAPPVSSATRLSSRPMLYLPRPRFPASAGPRLGLGAVRSDELGESRKLLLDESDGWLVGDLAGLIIDALGAVADEDLRLVQGHRVEEHHRAAQIVLHAGTADRARRGRLQRDRLSDERLVLQPRDPVDRILESSRNAEIVFRGIDDHAVGDADGIS